jgi:hypothetical protein
MLITLLIAGSISVDSRVTLDPRIKSIEFTAEGESGLCDSKGDWASEKRFSKWTAKVVYKIKGELKIDGRDEREHSVIQASTDHQIADALNDLRFRTFTDSWPTMFPQAWPFIYRGSVVKRTRETYRGREYNVENLRSYPFGTRFFLRQDGAVTNIAYWEQFEGTEKLQTIDVVLENVKDAAGTTFTIPVGSDRLVYIGTKVVDGKYVRDPSTFPQQRFSVRFVPSSIKINSAIARN